MFADFVAVRGTATYSNPASPNPPVSVTTTGEIAARALVVVRVSCVNVTANYGATNEHLSLTDTAGNSYAKAEEVSGAPGETHNGATVSLWWLQPDNAIPAGTVLTVAFAGDAPGRVISVAEYDTLDATNEVSLAGVASISGEKETGTESFSVTLSGLLDEDHLFVGAGAHSWSLASGWDVDGSFTTDLARTSAMAVAGGNNSVLWGQYRAVRTDSQAWEATASSPLLWAMVLAAFDLVPPPPPPPEGGTREYQSHFETDNHHVAQVTTERRPDAVAWDPRWARTTGPESIDQPGFGPESRRWQVRCDGPDVYVARASADHSVWEDEVLLTTAPGGQPINECDVAFTEDNTIVVVAERPTGSGDSPELWIYWYDPRFAVYRWQGFGAGRTPRCCNDYFPTSLGPHVCPPEIDVQVCYLKPGTGMVRLEQSTYYAEEFPTVLTYSAQRYLQQMFRTEDRRVSVLYSQRTPSTGRWLFGRTDSTPYADSLLRRPTFTNWTSPSQDIMRSLGDAWRTGAATTTWFLGVVTQDLCDAIEVQASAVYPTSGDDFDQQPQVAVHPGSGYTPGNGTYFSFEITHGAGTCSLVAFRARVRRDVGDVTCYSPWRYTVIPANYGGAEPNNIQAHCDRDLIVDVPEMLVGWVRHALVEGIRETEVSARLDPRPFVCGDPEVPTPVGWWFVGGSQNHEPSYPFPTHLQRFTYRSRPWEPVSISDEDGHYSTIVIGDVSVSTGGSPVSAKDFDWPSNRFPAQFPNDDGTMPALPSSLDVIGSTG